MGAAVDDLALVIGARGLTSLQGRLAMLALFAEASLLLVRAAQVGFRLSLAEDPSSPERLVLQATTIGVFYDRVPDGIQRTASRGGVAGRPQKLIFPDDPRDAREWAQRELQHALRAIIAAELGAEQPAAPKSLRQRRQVAVVPAVEIKSNATEPMRSIPPELAEAMRRAGGQPHADAVGRIAEFVKRLF